MEEQEENDFEKVIENMVASQILKCRSSSLVSQLQKVFPGMENIKRPSLQAALCQSEGSLMTVSKGNNKEIIKIPRKSAVNDEIIIEDYAIHNSTDELCTKNFVRKLPVPIQEKRIYRDNMVNFWKTPAFVKFQRYMSNKYEDFLNWFDFWIDTFKTIEGQHGAAVLAYFLFLRFLLYMNIIFFVLNVIFIITPGLLFSHSDTNPIAEHIVSRITDDTFSTRSENLWESSTKVYSHHWNELKFTLFHTVNHANHTFENITRNSSLDVIIPHCKILYLQQVENSTSDGVLSVFLTILQGTGPFEFTIIFTGFYPPFNVTPLGHVYNVPFAFICILLAIFIISCIMMIQYSSRGVQETFLSQNTRTNFYSNEIFSCWDYCIKDIETAALQHEKIVLELKTNLFEDRSEKKISKRSLSTQIKIIIIRLLINAFIVIWLFGSLYSIYVGALYQMRVLKDENLTKFEYWIFFIQYLPSTIVAVLNCISPVIFDMLVYFEQYSSRTSANVSLLRNVFLYLSSVIVLLNTVESHVACKAKDLCGVGLDETCHSPRCWETYVGQQLYKLTLVDIAIYLSAFLCYDVVQYFITTTFDNTLTNYWGHPVFFLPTEVLTLVYSQTVLWLGVPYSPMLPFLMICKLLILFYIKRIKILFLCDPVKESYRASKFNNVFISILFVSFFFALMVHSYAIENIPPSRGCGPFRYFESMSKAVPQSFRHSFSFLMSHWFITIAVIILSYAIYYYWRSFEAQKELAERLKFQLQQECSDKKFLLKSISKDKSKKKVKRSLIRR